jgi:type I restriction enzyme S subunit
MTNWKEYKLGEIADFIDYRGKTPKKTTFGVPLITAKIVKNGTIKEPSEYISKEDYPKWMTRGFPKVGDVVLTTEAPLGEVAHIKDASYALAQRIITLRGKQNLIENGYLKYFLQSEKGQQRLKERETGTTVTGIKSSELKQVLISAPDLKTQTAIAEILSSLDDKIELNNKINQELENLAQTLFKQWFIDFEFPNQNGDPYKSSGGEMVDSELGEIPKGWEVGTFGDLCKIVNGYAFKSKDFQEKGSNGILKIRNVNGNVVDIINTQFVSNGVVQSVQDKFKVLSGHILIAMTGAEVGKTGIVPETDKSLWLNQRVGRLEPIIDNSKVFIYHMFNVLNFTQAVRNSAMGSAQPNISASGIESLNCLIPAEEVALNFSSINLDSFNLTLKNMGENQELTNLRDTLLPKLISGELEVSEVKEG